MEWKAGNRYTIVGVGEMLAMTSKSEITIKELPENKDPVFTLRGKRKLKTFFDGWKAKTLVFEGWDIPLKADSDQEGSYIMRGNACYNFLGDTKFVREFVQKNNINEHFARHDAILACEPGNKSNDGIPVFPEVATEHKVVLDLRKKHGMDKEAPPIISSYGREEAKSDGVLMDNPKRNKFHECDIITRHLMDYATDRVLTGNFIFTEPETLIAGLMNDARKKYEAGQFEGDNDKDFFVINGDEKIKEVWFVRNEAGMLTAMLPEDY